MVFLEYLKQLVLANQFAQLRGVFLRRDAQQHAVVVLHKFEEMDLRRVYEQCAVIVVGISVDVVIFGI